MGPTEYSIVVSAISYGSIAGSLLSGKAADFFGRKKLMLIVAPLAALGWLLIGLANTIYMVYVGRLICGLATGFLFAIVPEDLALESLQKLRGPKYDVEMDLKEMVLKLSTTGEKHNYRELIKKRTLIPMLIALLIQTSQQACVNYSNKPESSIDAQMATIFTGVAQLIGIIISLFIVDKYGRRILLSVSVFLTGLMVALFGGYFIALNSENPWASWSPLAIILALLLFYCLGCRSIPWFIMSEIFNTSSRSVATSVCVFYNRLLNLIIGQVFPYAAGAFGYSEVFIFFGVISIFIAIAIVIFVPETKGKTLEEIQELFEKQSTKKKKSEEQC
ncbi:Facilitated trehalose transporter Tret1 [Armadillidium nasatum]|uniref:Facilitated trehalose transporter Tret1 n=1 Tax=Armadillidium nasatum TaxID=96803 RepID=A0A5N5SUI1_9CRUS|nr:Facilitated trehalose transporter Tret1 [Armadillidium nasatum]